MKAAPQLADRLLPPVEVLMQIKSFIRLDEGQLPKVIHRAEAKVCLC